MIIDMHAHIYPPIIAKATVEKLASIVSVTPFTDGTYTDTLEKYKQNGIDKVCFLNIAAKANKENTLNNFAKTLCNEASISFASVNPNSDNAFEVLEKIYNEGFVGIKFHPEYQHFAADDKRAIQLYALAAEMGLIMSFHAGEDSAFIGSDFAHPYRLARALDKVDSHKIILAHMGGMAKWNEVLECIAGRDCFIDTAMCATYMPCELFSAVAEAHGTNRILFGSDCPWESPLATLEYVKSIVVKTEDLDKILANNAITLLGLNKQK